MVLGLWGGLFWFLQASGNWSLYLSTRTNWVIPIGAGLFTVAAIGRLASARVGTPERLSVKQARALGLMVVPIIVVLALPPGTLTSYAASRRGSFVQAGVSTSASDISSGALSFIDVAGGQTSKVGQRALSARAGEQVTFLGFVTREETTPADEFLLTRFIVTCCVADATIAQVRIVNAPPGSVQQDEWVEVSGTIYPVGREVILDQSRIAAAEQPNPAYLTP